MYELKMEQVAEVSGGWFMVAATILGIGIAVIAAADELEDFGVGFSEGFERGSKRK